MFKRILIANRGEIACRVIETARKMGVETVAVYSDADKMSRHMLLADRSYCIGKSPVGESYLCGDKIIHAAIESGAEAIHPGYGFLSENPIFVRQVKQAGLTFIGPSADAIDAMGLKDAAKVLMEKAGVPVVPGYHGDNQDDEFLSEQAADIGYPVMIKAVAGGGGKGMRLAQAAKEFIAALKSARSEAKAAFGNADVLIEKFVTNPRHIEIQVFGDDHGNVVHLFERDCSLQRRHQKVIEEAPAPGMPEEVRKIMGDAAVKAAKAISYAGAGTIEFIVDGSGPLRTDGFWFMEMNTRLQVEHPVTEAITGVDLVEWQLRVAAGEALPLAQEELSINGWAFEARIYAEDVPGGFLPSTGTLTHLQFPEGARIDTGVRAGDEISPYYDPMIAKLTVHDETREMALGRLTGALQKTQVAGSVTNVEFLTALSQNADFVAAKVDTGLIARDLAGLTAQTDTPYYLYGLAALYGMGLAETSPEFVGFALWQPVGQVIALGHLGEVAYAKVTPRLHGCYEIALDNDPTFRPSTFEKPTFVLHAIYRDGWIIDEVRCDVAAAVYGNTISLFHDGAYHFDIIDPLDRTSDTTSNANAILSPMPGLVKQISVAIGDQIKQGDLLVVLEAMKMEHAMTAPRDGVVEAVPVNEGQLVEAGVVLVALKDEA